MKQHIFFQFKEINILKLFPSDIVVYGSLFIVK